MTSDRPLRKSPHLLGSPGLLFCIGSVQAGGPRRKESNVFGRLGLPVLAMLAAACVLVAGAGAVTKPVTPKRVDVTTAAGLAQYLQTLKIKDWARIVVQSGDRNYAGPNCPGVGWTCTTAKRVLQYGPNNSFQCSASNAFGGGSIPPNQCTIVQVAATS